MMTSRFLGLVVVQAMQSCKEFSLTRELSFVIHLDIYLDDVELPRLCMTYDSFSVCSVCDKDRVYSSFNTEMFFLE